MFVRTKTVTSNKKKYEYYQLVQSVRKNGKPRQEVLMTLGPVDNFDRSKVDEIVKALEGYTDKMEVLKSLSDLHFNWSKGYGAVYVLEKLWKELRLNDMFSKLLKDHHYEFDVLEAIKAMVFNRAISPLSKLSTYEWLERDVFFPQGNKLKPHHLYRAMDFLIDHKEALEKHIYSHLTNLFSLDLSVVFYDCTLVDVYGEKADLVQPSRKGAQQFSVSLALSRDGLPIAHQVYSGNTSDIETVEDALSKLKERFSIGRCIFVADRGMVSKEKLKKIEAMQYKYIVGVRLNQWKEVKEKVLAAKGRYSEIKDNLFVKEVMVQNKRYLICYNPYEAQRDEEIRAAVVEDLKEQIKNLNPHSKKAAELYGHKFKGRFLKRLNDGTLRIDYSQIREDKKYDGKYILLTNDKKLEKEEIATTYKRLCLIEQSFRSIKSINELEPVYHYADRRIKAHVFLCVLAHLLERFLEKKLNTTDVNMTSSRALTELNRMTVSKGKLKEKVFLIRTESTPEMNKIFKALRYQLPPRIQEGKV